MLGNKSASRQVSCCSSCIAHCSSATNGVKRLLFQNPQLLHSLQECQQIMGMVAKAAVVRLLLRLDTLSLYKECRIFCSLQYTCIRTGNNRNLYEHSACSPCRQSSSSPRTYRHAICWACARLAWGTLGMAFVPTRKSLTCSLITERPG